jgi:death on curing protein
MPVEILSVEDIKYIHECLIEEFLDSSNPICPPGVKDENLLASAAFRQNTSLNGIMKYPDPFSNAATLTFGICCDHPFHNGNKRTALVSLLAHLYNNRLSF